MGRNRRRKGRGGCSWDVLYERRIDKKLGVKYSVLLILPDFLFLLLWLQENFKFYDGNLYYIFIGGILIKSLSTPTNEIVYEI